jgi:hypothetical protein
MKCSLKYESKEDQMIAKMTNKRFLKKALVGFILIFSLVVSSAILIERVGLMTFLIALIVALVLAMGLWLVANS